MLIDPTVVTEEMSLMPGTRCPVFESFFIADNEMVLNIIDSPGLFERGSKVKDIRDNMAIMATIEECINREITKLHIICFCMSFGDGIQQEDVESVKILVKYLGEGIARNSCLIITRCESIDDEQRERMQAELVQDVHFKEIASYFQKDVVSKRRNIEERINIEFENLGKQHRQSKSIHQPIEQNILLLGPSNSGKRTLMKVLEDPCYIPPYETVSSLQNKNPIKTTIKCRSSNLTLNIVKIPGAMVDEEQDLNQINEACRKCGITQFHHVCICVSFQRGIFDKDIQLFKRLIKHFGEEKIKSHLNLVVTRCELKDEKWQANIEKEVKNDYHMSFLMQWFNQQIHFTGALDPIYCNKGDEEVILDQFKTIYNNREQFIQFIEHNCNIQPFNIQLQINPSPISIFEKNRR
ncbi:unnamed protein product [Rotaria sp. Silwood1]|nr:unnamed protein product [Rotaria sp. Silwood1]